MLGAEEFDAVILDTYRAAGWLGRKSSLYPSEGAGAVLVRTARTNDETMIMTAMDGQVYRNRRQLETAGKLLLSDHPDRTRLLPTATRHWPNKIEEALTSRFHKIGREMPYLGEAFAASASWQTLRALGLREAGIPLVVPVWGSNHQIGSLELK